MARERIPLTVPCKPWGRFLKSLGNFSGPNSNIRVATHQKVKNSLTFPWLFTGLLLMRNNRCSHSLCKSSIFFFSFSTSFRYLRKEEEGIWKKAFRTKLQNHWPAQLLHVSGIEWQSDHFTCFAAYFSSFPKENAFQNLEESFWTINRKTEFTDFSLTLTISKIFRDFSKHSLTFPTFKNVRFSLTFNWPWQPWIFKSKYKCI